MSQTWLVKRNCSASPRQLALVFGSLVAVSFAFGAGFAAQGLWMVLPFVGLELVAVAAAFICYGRSAGITNGSNWPTAISLSTRCKGGVVPDGSWIPARYASKWRRTPKRAAGCAYV